MNLQITVVITILVAGLGCQDVATIWTAEAKSPDGKWVALATTRQHGGPGTAGVETGVELRRTDDPHQSQLILGVFHDPNSTFPKINLTMTWLSLSHLDIAYEGRATLTFQVVKYQGVDISVHEISTVTSNPTAQ